MHTDVGTDADADTDVDTHNFPPNVLVHRELVTSLVAIEDLNGAPTQANVNQTISPKATARRVTPVGRFLGLALALLVLRRYGEIYRIICSHDSRGVQALTGGNTVPA